ncbi:lysophospholipase 1 [[Candida] anglica]|uniref:Lysophospholipase n=1 Tax=[Candida] anglica TaxID=148631 RepID=A0ABP0EFM5_9ASCO
MNSFLFVIVLLECVLAWSPTNSYAPGKIECPADPKLIRTAQGLCNEESTWLQGRNAVTKQNVIAFLESANMTDFNAKQFFSNATKDIKIGLAFSGGGYRAMLAGAGQLAALDSRTQNANSVGLGGLLQSSTYISGLSGGSWLVGTIAMNNFTSVETILNEGVIWDLTHSIANYGGLDFIRNAWYINKISSDLRDKSFAGYQESLTDPWGRSLSFQFFTKLKDKGAALTWSTLQEVDVFTNHQMPFPIIVSDARTDGINIIDGNATIVEFNPYEFGSWDPSLHQFSKVKYLGTKTVNGEHDGNCIGGYDNAGFILGTSSSLFNEVVLKIDMIPLIGTLHQLIQQVLSGIWKNELDIAIYKPNPFYKTNVGTVSKLVTEDSLYLVDGGEDGQNVPLAPLIEPDREVDVIFAFDNSADTNDHWPDGSSLVATYKRQFLAQGNGTHFPPVPDTNSFRNLNLTSRPAFFGCDAKNLSSLVGDKESVFDVPLVVYTANRPFSYPSNVDTFQLFYSESQKRGMIKNGFETATRLNGTLDEEWNACVGCAIIRRQQERQGIEQSDQCKGCFERYCWKGDTDTANANNLQFTPTGLSKRAKQWDFNFGPLKFSFKFSSGK